MYRPASYCLHHFHGFIWLTDKVTYLAYICVCVNTHSSKWFCFRYVIALGGSMWIIFSISIRVVWLTLWKSYNHYYFDVKWASNFLKSPEFRLFALEIVEAEIKKISKVRITCALWRESTGDLWRRIHRWPVESPHNGTSSAESVSMSKCQHASPMLVK